jgi:hypothetical protein
MMTEIISLFNQVVMRGNLHYFGSPHGVIRMTRLAPARWI